MNRALILLVASCMAVGCVSMGRKIDQSAVDSIKKGETTKDDVVKMIGSPDQVTTNADGNTIFTYMFVRATPTPGTFIPIVGPLVSGTNVQNQTLLVTFGPDGIVKDYTNTHGAQTVGTGVVSASGAQQPDVEQNKRPK